MPTVIIDGKKHTPGSNTLKRMKKKAAAEAAKKKGGSKKAAKKEAPVPKKRPDFVKSDRPQDKPASQKTSSAARANRARVNKSQSGSAITPDGAGSKKSSSVKRKYLPGG